MMLLKLIKSFYLQGGINATSWEASGERRSNVELAHEIFGYRAISALMSGSNAQIWDDTELVFAGDS